MKSTITFTGILIVLMCSCKKDPTPISLPNEVNFNESVLFLNGELSSGYKPVLFYQKVNKIMTYGFVERVDDIINSVGFDLLPLSTGDFGLHTQHVISSFEAVTNFNQIINEDLEGYSYKLIDTDDGFFKVESMDTIQQIVKGRFQAKFKRTSKNGNKDLGLSKILLFQGVFNEHYEVK